MYYLPFIVDEMGVKATKYTEVISVK